MSYVKLLYEGTTVLLAVGGGLSYLSPMKRGIPQGCPLSGQWYSLAIEPLLWMLKSVLKGDLVPGDSAGSAYCVLCR